MTRPQGVRWAAVRKLALSFPGMTEGTSYGEPAFLLDGKFFSRFNEKERGLVVYAEEALRDLEAEGSGRGFPPILGALVPVSRGSQPAPPPEEVRRSLVGAGLSGVVASAGALSPAASREAACHTVRRMPSVSM